MSEPWRGQSCGVWWLTPRTQDAARGPLPKAGDVLILHYGKDNGGDAPAEVVASLGYTLDGEVCVALVKFDGDLAAIDESPGRIVWHVEASP